MESQTFTTTLELCEHKNGRYNYIDYNWFIFQIRAIYFVCTDCGKMIPIKKPYINLI